MVWVKLVNFNVETAQTVTVTEYKSCLSEVTNDQTRRDT